MKKVFFIFMMICSFSSCAQETKKIQLISQEEFAKILTKEIQLLDVRTPQEYQQGYIEGAILINFFDSDFVSKVSALTLDTKSESKKLIKIAPSIYPC